MIWNEDPGREFYFSIQTNKNTKHIGFNGYAASYDEPLFSSGFSACHTLALRDKDRGKCCLVHIFLTTPENILKSFRDYGSSENDYKGIAQEFKNPENVSGFHIYHKEKNLLDLSDIGNLFEKEKFNEIFAENGFKDIEHLPLYPEKYKYARTGREMAVDPKTATVYIFPRDEHSYLSLSF